VTHRSAGTRGPDIIDGAAGDDTIRGRGGADVLCGGDGDDVFVASPGEDRVEGDAGADRVLAVDRGADGARDGLLLARHSPLVTAPAPR